MKANTLYTKQRMGLDGKVWLVMLFTAIVCIGLSAYKAAVVQPCSPFTISIKGRSSGEGKSFYLGEQIDYKASMNGTGKVEWLFDDKTLKMEGQRVTHSFYKEGKHTITIVINGSCREDRVITVKNIAQHQSNNSSTVQQILANPIMGNATTEVGKSITFYSSVPADSAYEWIVLNSPNNPTFNTNQATYTFVTQGARTIQLTLDKDPLKVYTKVISVEPLYVQPGANPRKNDPLPPPPIVFVPQPKKEDKPVIAENVTDNKQAVEEKKKPEPEKPKTKIIGNELLKGFLEDVVDENMSVADFNAYLCAKGGTKVLENGKYTDFSTLVEHIRGKGKIRIDSVEIFRDENNCVTSITVRYHKKGLF